MITIDYWDSDIGGDVTMVLDKIGLSSEKLAYLKSYDGVSTITHVLAGILIFFALICILNGLKCVRLHNSNRSIILNIKEKRKVQQLVGSYDKLHDDLRKTKVSDRLLVANKDAYFKLAKVFIIFAIISFFSLFLLDKLMLGVDKLNVSPSLVNSYTVFKTGYKKVTNYFVSSDGHLYSVSDFLAMYDNGEICSNLTQPVNGYEEFLARQVSDEEVSYDANEETIYEKDMKDWFRNSQFVSSDNSLTYSYYDGDIYVNNIDNTLFIGVDEYLSNYGG